MTTPPIGLNENVSVTVCVPVEVVETLSIAMPGNEPHPPPEGEMAAQGSDLWLYRDRTIGMLRRYLRLSIEVGRLPSLLGREFFRTRVTSYTVSTFENAVIFVHDIERILDDLDDFDHNLIAKIVFQDYSQDEAAHLLNCGRRTVVRRFPEAVDGISKSFLDGGLLARLPVVKPKSPETCQEGETSQNEVEVSE